MNDEEKKCEEYLNGWKRALADYDNLKKEIAGERVKMYQSASEQITQSLLPILDNFDQALSFKPESLDEKAENWLKGILHVRTQIENVMHELGLEQFGKEGEKFDPHLHEAISEHESEKETEIILQVIQRGWKRGDRIMRPAKVTLSK